MEYISTKNKYVEEYLDFYSSSIINDYAVLIDGDWGEGKSWFIKQYIEKYKKNHNKLDVVYISLNGINNKKSIDDQIFASLFPVLSNPKVKAVGRIITNSIKLAVKIDLSEDPDSKATLSVPDTKIFTDLLSRDKNLLLIFDDFERCEIGMKEILGYINYFVEYADCKAIIVANQNKIDAEKFKIFNSEKEKLICTTLKLTGDFKVAYHHFIDYLNDDIRSILNTNFELIENCFTSLNCNNIRILKQSLYDFERLNSLINFKDEPELVENFIKRFFFYSICLKNNFINLECKYESYSFEITKDKESESEIYNLIDKYLTSCRCEYNIISEKIWNDIISKNIIDVDTINQKIKENYWDLKEKCLAWVEIVDCLRNNINYSYFIELFEEMLDDLKKDRYEDIGDIYHTISNVIYFEKILENIDISVQKSVAFAQIERLCNKMSREEIDLFLRFSDEYKKGFEYLAISTQEFLDFLVESKKNIEKIQSDNIYKHANELVELLDSDDIKLKKFRADIYYDTTGSGGIYCQIPILEKIDQEIFVNKLLDLNRNNIRYVVRTITDRFQGLNRSIPKVEWLENEKKWIEGIYNLLELKSQNLDNLDKFFIEKNILKWIKGHVIEHV